MSNNNTPTKEQALVAAALLQVHWPNAYRLLRAFISGAPDAANAGAPTTNEKGGSHAVGSTLRADVSTEGRDSVTNAQMIEAAAAEDGLPEFKVTVQNVGIGGSMAVFIDDFEYVRVNYRYGYTDNYTRAALANDIAAVIKGEKVFATPTGVAADESRGQPTLREDAMYAMGYQRGAKDGWNFCISDDQEGFARTQASSEHVRVLRDTRAADESTRAPDERRPCPTCEWVKSARDAAHSPAYPHTCGREQKTCVGGCWKNNGEPCGDCPASRASLAAESTSPAPDGWQPIATAPKDGTAIRLFCEGFIDPDFNPGGSVEGFWLDGIGWMGAVWDGYRDCWDTREDIQPTHWQPLPAPPSGERPSAPAPEGEKRNG